MKTFTAKTLEEAIALAVGEFKVAKPEDLIYDVLEDKKGIFKKSAKIQVYETSDIIDYAIDYLTKVIQAFAINPTFTPSLDEDIIRIVISTDHNSILIGKNGQTLQALNEIVKLATSSRFKKRIRILLDINEYKEEKYAKVISIARRTAKEVQRTKVEAILDPMPADERRMIHNALSKFANIKTESIGAGHRRQIAIKYVD